MLFNRGIDTVKITALSNDKPGIFNNYIRIVFPSSSALKMVKHKLNNKQEL